MHKRQIVTSWPISFFWVFLSVTMAVLATYSFLQADWVIKRNLIVTNYYQPDNFTQGSDTVPSSTSKLNPIIPTTRGTPFSSSSSASPASSRGRKDSQFLKKTNNDNLNQSHLVEILLEKYEKYNNVSSNTSISRINNNSSHMSGDSRLGYHVRRVIKVTRVVTTVRFGTIGVCTTVRSLVQCTLYSAHDVYPISSIWPMVTLIGGSGCITLCVSAVLSLLAVALPSSHLRHQVATTIGHAQTLAVVLLFMSLLLFPLGFDSGFVRYHCGSYAGPYNIGDCEIGWAYALVLVCASLSLYCPVLVKFTADIRYDALPKYL